MLSSLDEHCRCKTFGDFVLGAGSGVQSIGCVVEGLQICEEPIDVVVNVCHKFRPEELVECLRIGRGCRFLSRINDLLVQLVCCSAIMISWSH